MKARAALLSAVLAVAVPPTPAAAFAAPPTPVTKPAPARTQAAAPAGADTSELTRTSFTLDGKPLPAPVYHPGLERRSSHETPPVGTVRPWLGLNVVTGGYYPKMYTLRGVGSHIEVWVADDLAFPAGDCRHDPVTVSDAQVNGLITQFDDNIYPLETAAFSTPPDRDGSHAMLPGLYDGAGDRTVTLVDNVRDANYVDFPAQATYIAGFFSAQLNELFDRNVMTIDAYDWAHRTGANPPDASTADLCTSRPTRPWLYEATFAHEWQHLLEYYADPAEVPWVNEGLSDYAQTLTGYTDPAKTVWQPGFDSHLACFRGFGDVKTNYNTNPRECGGPANSLNLWNEGTPDDVLADYGNAYQFMLYLRSHFGPDMLTRLHRDRTDQGLAGVRASLPAGHPLFDVLHAYQIATLTDSPTVNLQDPMAYGPPGAAPNGADYVRLRDGEGRYLSGADLRSVTFDFPAQQPPLPLAWTFTGGTMFSGNASSTDASAVADVTVPHTDPVLRLSSSYATEPGYDFGYVEVSTDGGRTYRPVAGNRTVAGPLGPGIDGSSAGAYVPLSYDLSAYAGQRILLGFRYVSDSSIDAGGWYLREITVGGTPVPVAPATFRSPTQVRPVPVHGLHAVLVGINPAGSLVVPVAQWKRLAGFAKVVAVVGYDEPTELVTQYARYRLTANGVVQPG